MTLHELATTLRQSRGFAHKRDIGDAVGALERALPGGAFAGLGDDCAALPDGDGHLLFAIEGFVADFVATLPWFAGWCGVMVNVSDVYAMGGRPIAVVDAIWSRGADTSSHVMAGLAAASARYGVPVVGGHSNHRSDHGQLAVAIVGRARRLLTSFDARPGQQLVMAIDLRGAYQEPHPYWNASTTAPGERLRGDLEVLPGLAEDGLCGAAKDISMAGAVGTALMLLECSEVGAVIDVEAIPRPPGVPLARWLLSFPSYGFVLSVEPGHTAEVLARFAARGIAAAVVGEVTASPKVRLRTAADEVELWDLGCTPFIRPRVAEAAHA